MPSIWTYCDPSDRGFGLFKRRVLQALQRLGWKVFLAEFPLLDPRSKQRIAHHLEQTSPDWIFLINQSSRQLCTYLELSSDQHWIERPTLIWYLDDPHFFVEQEFGEHDIVLSFDETYLPFLSGLKPSRLGWMPLAADISCPGTFDPAYACDISFVGGVIDQTYRRAQLSSAIVAYVDRLVELKLNHREKSFYELIDEHPISPGKTIQINPQVAHYLYWEANNRYRLSILERLMKYDLRIYGNEDWKVLLRDSPLSDRYHGPIDPVRDLPSVFASSKINLNIHSIQCQGSLNQRDFNAPMASGFLLSDWVPAAGRFFQPGKEAVYWASVNDLIDKVEFYLNYPKEKVEIIQSGRRRVMNDHTYSRRMESIAPFF